MLKLYQVHCGYYDFEINQGLYEMHQNFFVVAESFAEARSKAKEIPEFKMKKMHVDGLLEITTVQGHHITLTPTNTASPDHNELKCERFRELAPMNDTTLGTN